MELVTMINAAAPFSIGNVSAITVLRVSIYELHRRSLMAALERRSALL
jgi:hypothetical protein